MDQHSTSNPPIFNLPAIVTLMIVFLIFCHVLRMFLVGGPYEVDFILLFAAIPARYSELSATLPYAQAMWYTPVTYAFLHGDWTHLIFNLAWLLAFGAPVAKRLGGTGFIILFVLSVVVAFVFHLFTHWGEYNPLIGASGAVSAYMGAAIRLPRVEGLPILPLHHSLRNRGILAFIIIWMFFNLLVGLMPGLIGVEDAEIAWQAHVGGFVTGLLLINLLDRLGQSER